MTENNDPWANLADSLGAAPGGEPSQKPQSRPIKPSKPAEAEKPASKDSATEAPRTDWGGVADQLGIEGSKPAPSKPATNRASQKSEPAPRVSDAESQPRDDGFGAGLLDDGAPTPRRSSRPRSQNGERRKSAPRPHRSEDDSVQEAPRQRERSQDRSEDRSQERSQERSEERSQNRSQDRSEGRSQDRSQERDHERGENATDESGEPRRRRRGRRGGRGRGRRTDQRSQEEGRVEVRAEDSEDLPGYGRNLDGERHERQGSPSSESASEGQPRTSQDGDFGQVLNADTESNEREVNADGRDDRRESSDDDRPPRRRRRRRGRGRRTRDGVESEHDESRTQQDEHGEASSESRDISRDGEGTHTQRDTRRSEDSDGEPRRRRRRRRTSDDDSQEPRGEDRPARRSSRSEGTSSQRQSTRGGGRKREVSRGGDGESRRRETFSRVGSQREDDEEGLEFLGTEDEMAPVDRRDATDEDVLSESGLDSVRDVPSWVEAIGIVIASNMDSRKQPPQS